MSEGDVEAAIGEGIGLGVALVGEGAIEGEGDSVPLFELAAEGDGTVAIGLAGDGGVWLFFLVGDAGGAPGGVFG